MPTHRVLRSIAHDVAQTLISRNDDVAGYWALGQLLSYALSNKAVSVAIDLTCGESKPSLQDSPLSVLPAQWSEVFWRNVAQQKLQRSAVDRASASISFGVTKARQGTRGGDVEYPVLLQVSIQDDRGRVYSRSADVWCSPHDPKLELKSTRGA